MFNDLLGGRSWVIEVARIERVQIVGKKDEYDNCLQWLQDNGYSIVRSGPYTDSQMYPKVDATRFLFVAERTTDT